MILLGFEFVAIGLVFYYVYKGCDCSDQRRQISVSNESLIPSEEVPPPYSEN